MAIKAIIFDMDGVLIDSEDAHYHAYKAACNKYGISYSIKMHKSFSGKSSKEIIRLACERSKSIYGCEDIRKLKESIVLRTLDKVKTYPGVKPTLDSLRKTYLLGLATSSTGRVTRRIRKLYGFDIMFRKYAVADEVKNAKPAPDLFLLCAKKLGVRPSECVVIEDSHFGVLAAKRAGMKVIAITNTLPRRELASADRIITRISQINRKMIETLGN